MNWQHAMAWRDMMRQAVEAVPAEQLPDLVAELARADAIARQRMLVPDPSKNDPEPDRLLRAAEVAERLSVSVKWVYRHQGRLGGTKLGGAVRFSERAVESYIDACRRP